MLMIVFVEMIPTRFAIVTNIFIVVTVGKPTELAFVQERSILGRSVRIVTPVLAGIKKIHGGFVGILPPTL